MAAHTLAPADYSPDRDTPKAAVAMLAAVAIFGLWRGFAHEFAAERIGGPDAPAADAYSPRAATALPAVAAGVDTLIPPEAEPVPVVPVAPKPKAAPLDVVVTGEIPSVAAQARVEVTPEPEPPTLQEPEVDPAPPVEDEPPPDNFDPYN